MKNTTATSPPQHRQPLIDPQLSTGQPTTTGVHDSADTLTSPPTSFDKHFVVPLVDSSTSRFFGASSVFTLTVNILEHAYKRAVLERSEVAGFDPERAAEPDYGPTTRDHFPQPDAVRSLLSLYFVSLNVMYGFVDEATAEADLEVYFAARNREGFHPRHLRGDEAHQYFRISMMCAVACANKARYQTGYLAESMVYYEDAANCVEEVTSEVSPASLQALLLLTIFCLFYPRKGDIWKLLDYACRLSVELGYHTEQEVDHEDDTHRKMRRSTFWGLYAIERIVGQLFGRASDLPEPIITTEYPSVSPEVDFLDQATFQPISIAHHYRLVYLRSEIYRDLYLPATPPEFEMKWYHDRYMNLFAWRQELSVPNDLAGVATITCDVGYHSTMCFLFQPLMLQALLRTKTIDPEVDDLHLLGPVPQDNYWSACTLVKTYEKVMRAPEFSPLGTYPMTFMSAHYIYLAGLTLMAHCLLAIDGRVRTMRPMAEPRPDQPLQPIDFSNVYEVSGSCLILLTWCAEKWPGMVGMLDVYKRLSERLIPALMRKGLA